MLPNQGMLWKCIIQHKVITYFSISVGNLKNNTMFCVLAVMTSNGLLILVSNAPTWYLLFGEGWETYRENVKRLFFTGRKPLLLLPILSRVVKINKNQSLTPTKTKLGMFSRGQHSLVSSMRELKTPVPKLSLPNTMSQTVLMSSLITWSTISPMSYSPNRLLAQQEKKKVWLHLKHFIHSLVYNLSRYLCSLFLNKTFI